MNGQKFKNYDFFNSVLKMISIVEQSLNSCYWGRVVAELETKHSFYSLPHSYNIVYTQNANHAFYLAKMFETAGFEFCPIDLFGGNWCPIIPTTLHTSKHHSVQVHSITK